MKLKCLHCGYEFDGTIEKDYLGWHSSCPECEGSFDVDIVDEMGIHILLGTIILWEGKRWYVDNTDEEFKDDDEETSLFLLPEKYADADENDRLYRYGKVDDIGFWVHESDIEVIE